MRNRDSLYGGWAFLLLLCASANGAELTRVDLSRFDPALGVAIEKTQETIRATWPIDAGSNGVLEIDLDPDKPLLRGIGISQTSAEPKWILQAVDPSMVLTVGSRDLARQGWMVFFDKVPTRPFRAHAFELARKTARVVTEAGRTSIVIDGASAGPFSGEMRFTFYPGSALVHAKAVMETHRPATAYLIDAGIISRDATTPPWKQIVYTNNEHHAVSVSPEALKQTASRVAVRNRLIGAEGVQGGHVFVLPHPHQYFYPLDFCDNLRSAWVGSAYRDRVEGSGFGVCQTIEGDRRYVPWVNAPPGSKQEMGVFYLLDAGDRDQAMKAALAYTRGDRFDPVEGHKTFSSHYHVEMTIERLKEIEARKKDGEPDLHKRPEFVDVFRDMNVEIVHLGEFHLGDRELAIAPRIDRLKLMHEECARWSDERFLLLPGEEPNVHLGGHWVSFFPKPVYWTLDRAKDQPFVEEDANLGKVYHVGNAEDVLKLMEAEGGLMWAAHPRIKGSIGFPDVYRQSDYFKSDRYLGGAWKAMPADYSIPKMGTRVLDLLDDMSNWGAKKQIVGEVDVFAIDRQSELYAHMNVNYLRMNAIPRFEDGWQPVLDALRAGAYFTSTGEVLMPSFTIDGKASGETLARPSGPSTVQVALQWTFPLDYAELVSGDGSTIHRQRVDLSRTRAFGSESISFEADLTGKTWARLEVWDVARNGAFSQPVWIQH